MLSCKGFQRRSPQSSAPETYTCHFEGGQESPKMSQRGLRTEEAIIKAFDILDFISRLNLASYHHGRTDGALKVIL